MENKNYNNEPQSGSGESSMARKKENDLILFLSDDRGVYIPRDFATDVKREFVKGVSDEDYQILEQGPEHEHYWETWDMILQNARIKMTRKGRYNRILYQEGGLWVGTPTQIDRMLEGTL